MEKSKIKNIVMHVRNIVMHVRKHNLIACGMVPTYNKIVLTR